MGLFDALFGNRNQIPTVTTILPDAARQEIIAGRLPILNTDKLFLKRGEKIHFIDKAINMEQKTVKEFRHVGGSTPGLFEGTRWSSGRGRTVEHTELVQHRGILYITNQRIVFQATEWGFDKTYRCDNDNVSFDNSKPGGVLGTPGFMAPEIVRGEKRPSKDTDRYSLSVLLFYLFMVNHPLEGKLEASIRCMDMAARVKLYGTDPVFIFDPNNKTNRPVKGIHDNATIYWPLYPEKLRQMFTRAFTVGLNEPSKRITEPEWMTLFSNMMSGMLQCSCGAQLFYDEDLETKGVAHTCWNCGKTIQVPNKIIIGKNRVLLHQNTKLLHHHVYDDFDMDTVVGSVVQNPKNPALWGIRNEDKVNWTYQKADGTQIPVAPGKTAGIAKGVKILFPESTGEFR